MIDNDANLSSSQLISFVQLNGISLFFADPRHSTSNKQIYRAHSTLTKIPRCIKDEPNLIDYSEIIIRAAQKYNFTIHSPTFNKIKHDQTP